MFCSNKMIPSAPSWHLPQTHPPKKYFVFFWGPRGGRQGGRGKTDSTQTPQPLRLAFGKPPSCAVETALRSGNGAHNAPFPSSQVVNATPWRCQESTCSPLSTREPALCVHNDPSVLPRKRLLAPEEIHRIGLPKKILRSKRFFGKRRRRRKKRSGCRKADARICALRRRGDSFRRAPAFAGARQKGFTPSVTLPRTSLGQRDTFSKGRLK